MGSMENKDNNQKEQTEGTWEAMSRIIIQLSTRHKTIRHNKNESY